MYSIVKVKLTRSAKFPRSLFRVYSGMSAGARNLCTAKSWRTVQLVGAEGRIRESDSVNISKVANRKKMTSSKI